MRLIASYTRVGLAGFLALTAVGKLWSGYQSHFSVSHELYAIAIVVELLLAVGLLFDESGRVASVGVGVLAAAGIAIEIFGGGGTCGCLGSLIQLTSAQHIIVNATAGALAVVVWSGMCTERRSR